MDYICRMFHGIQVLNIANNIVIYHGFRQVPGAGVTYFTVDYSIFTSDTMPKSFMCLTNRTDIPYYIILGQQSLNDVLMLWKVCFLNKK